jgi:uncharacterized protein (TIGR02266 family)
MRRRSDPKRRRYRRLTVRVMVEYESDDGRRCDPATTLGAGGLFIATESPLAEGTRLQLCFRLPDAEERWKIEGKVVWAQGREAAGTHACGMGIEFSDRSVVTHLARALEVWGGPA